MTLMRPGRNVKNTVLEAEFLEVRMGDIEGHVSFTCHQVRIPGSTIVVPVDGVVRFLELFEELKLDSETSEASVNRNRSAIIVPAGSSDEFYEMVGHFVEITWDRLEGMTDDLTNRGLYRLLFPLLNQVSWKIQTQLVMEN
ncbi:hypothetical protein OPV22_022488 [Ensete ventricosum]|uniref:Uncharacterized protein n=1 Tax=Ensete ventricosum TaxID=4639 RepID=A0AAV8PBX5_ENSVE|nr:hypothetical protein OPV22_022488 [Ensete ventricosum]